MRTPKNAAGQLTEHIMAGMPEIPADKYNRIWEAVYRGLEKSEEVGIAIVPDNDHAVMAVIAAWPSHKRKRFYRSVQAMLEP